MTRRGGVWQDDALCHDAPTELFFPDVRAGSNPHLSVGPVAEHWCRVCPVRAQCGEFADEYRLVGLWGGVWRTISVRSSYTRLPLVADAARAAQTTPAAARVATVRRLTATGRTARQIAAETGMSERSVHRLRGRAS